MHPALLQPKKLDLGSLNYVLRRTLALYARVEDGSPKPVAGGYVAVLSTARATLLVPPSPTGQLASATSAEFSFKSAEQLRRLFAQPQHVSSWQSRNPSVRPFGQHGGAIRGQQTIISFAGLTEMGNEAVALMIALMLEDLTLEGAIAIAQVSRNIVFDRMGMVS